MGSGVIYIIPKFSRRQWNGRCGMKRKFNTAAYRRNVRRACAGRAPSGYSTSIADNGDFVVYNASMDVAGRLTEWESF